MLIGYVPATGLNYLASKPNGYHWECTVRKRKGWTDGWMQKKKKDDD
jgi:hypothetical protein